METQADESMSGATQVIHSGEPELSLRSSKAEDEVSSLQLHQHTTETPFIHKLVDPFAESPLVASNESQASGSDSSKKSWRRNLFLGPRHDSGDTFSRIRALQQQTDVVQYESPSLLKLIMIDDEEEGESDLVDDSFKRGPDRQLINEDNNYDIHHYGNGYDNDNDHDNDYDYDNDNNYDQTQHIYDTQVIDKDTQLIVNSNGSSDVPGTQRRFQRSNIEVPGTLEKLINDYREDIFEKIESEDDDFSRPTLDISRLEKFINSDEEIENTTIDNKQMLGAAQDFEEESSSFARGFTEDSLRVYSQLKLKRRQFSDINQLNKRNKLGSKLFKSQIETPSKTSLPWLDELRKPIEIPNSSPSMIQISTSPIIGKSKEPLETQVIVTSQDRHTPKTLEIISSKQSTVSNDKDVPSSPNLLPRQTSTQDSSLTQIEDNVYRNPDDHLTRKDIKYYSSVWARTGDKFYPTVIQKVLQNGFTIIHEGKQVDLQGHLNVFPLDLKIGDRVKIFNKKKIHAVTGLARENNEPLISCIRGFDTVYVMPCTKNSIDYANGLEEKISMDQLYLVNSIWTKREFISELDRSEYQGSLASRFPLRGRNHAEFLELSPHKNSPPIVIGTSVIPQSDEIRPNPLKKCCFTITSSNSSNELEKTKISELIVQHGGKVLEHGIDEIFNIKANLSVSKFYSNYKFIAVISVNGFCRSAKYLECLLLGWPVLSSKFIEDVTLDPSTWTKLESYLLPAGESTYLNTIKSSNCSKFLENYRLGNSLDQQCQNNRILSGFKVVKKISKPQIPILDFLFYSLGVDQITDLVVENSQNNEKEIIFIDDGVMKNDNLKNFLKNKQVIDWEWLVQCIINGQLLKFNKI